jgi:ATP-dependent Clp protease ATP-binding subunit ClpA
VFERFTDKARQVVVLAQEEAKSLDHNYIGTEHLLLGLLRLPDSIAAKAIESAGLTLEAARAQVEEIIGRGSGNTPGAHIPFTPRAKKILELSLRESLEQRKNYIGTDHVLLALIREGEGVGALILARVAAASALRQRVIEMARGTEPADPGDTRRTAYATDRPLPTESFVNLRIPAATVIDFRRVVASIELRLANIQRHLGIPAEEQEPVAAPQPGALRDFRRLLTSIQRGITNIEHHLGIPTEDHEPAPPEPTDPPETPPMAD